MPHPPAPGGPMPPAWGSFGTAPPADSPYVPPQYEPPYGQEPYGQPPYAAYPDWGPPAGQPRTEPWSIVALTLGVCALAPLALVAGVVALVRIHGNRARGRGLAIGGMCAAGVWIALAVVVFAVLPSALGWSSDSYRVGDAALASELFIGDCLDGAGDSDQRVVSCDEGHDAEVSVVAELPRLAPTTSQDSLNTIADEMCYSAFKVYVGSSYEDSEFEYAFFSPSPTEWVHGDRRVACLVTPYDGSLRGSVRNSGG